MGAPRNPDAKRNVTLRFRPSVLAAVDAARGGRGLQAWFDEAVADRLAKSDPVAENLLRVERQMPPPVFEGRPAVEAPVKADVVADLKDRLEAVKAKDRAREVVALHKGNGRG